MAEKYTAGAGQRAISHLPGVDLHPKLIPLKRVFASKFDPRVAAILPIRGAGGQWARSKFWTDSRRELSFDTSTKPDAPVSWGASEMGRGTAVSMIGAVAWCARFPARNGAEGEKIWIARKKA